MSETYIAIDNTEIDLDSPLTTSLFFQLRDNPIAITEGHVDAPRNQDASLDTGAATVAGTTWVGKRTAGLTFADIGSYAVLRYTDTTTKYANDSISGALLEYDDAPVSTATLTGTSWRYMGADAIVAGGNDQGLFLRIS